MSLQLNAQERLSLIESLLDRERDALRAGKLDALDALIGEREAHVAALHGGIGPKDRAALTLLREIQVKARRNARLLGAARQGFEAGSKRLAEMAAVREKLSTYSENGQVSDIMDGKSRVQKKA